MQTCYYLIENGPCPACEGGTKRFPANRCAVCGATVTLADVQPIFDALSMALLENRPTSEVDHTMPCGHHIDHWIEWEICPECNGGGRREIRRDITASLEQMRDLVRDLLF